MTRVYIAAGSFATRERLRPARDALRKMGYTITATWLDEEDGGTSPEYHLRCAARDLLEVQNCDLLILDTLTEGRNGGREVEFGISLTAPAERVIVGPVRNVFHQLANQRFETWEAALEYFGSREI